MSHFKLYVIGSAAEAEDIMRPFERAEHSNHPMATYVDKTDLARSIWEKRILIIDAADGGWSRARPGTKNARLEKLQTLYPNFEEMCIQYLSLEKNPNVPGFFGKTCNPKGFWEWYSVGGRWAEEFTCLPGVMGPPGAAGVRSKQTCSMFKRDIDVKSMRNAAKEKAESLYNQFEQCTKGLSTPLSWDETLAANNYLLEETRIAYFSQPAIIAMQKERIFPLFIPVNEMFYNGKEHLLNRFTNRVLVPYAFIYKGELHSQGKISWFGHYENTYGDGEWAKIANGFFDTIGPNDIITTIDCHV